MNPNLHKLIIQVFDENRITRDDFLGMVELSLRNLPKERPDENIDSKIYYLQPKRFALSGIKVDKQPRRVYQVDCNLQYRLFLVRDPK